MYIPLIYTLPEVISEGLGPLNPSMSQEEYFSV